jgi:outer membrane protein assembly factor BamB
VYVRLLLAAASVSALLAADWARFRGPNGSGTVADKDVPVKWTDDNVLWKTELTGKGHSSPIVVKGKVFLLSATDKERSLVCLDADKGKQLWSKKAPGKFVKIRHDSSFASSTPCSDGERVYCAFWDGSKVSLHAYDLDGKALWQQDLGEFKSQHGHGFSPIVHDGLVIVNNDQDGTAQLQAFFAKTGKPAWSVKRKAFRTCYSTPFILETKGGPELVVGSTAGVTRYNPADGKELWNFEWKFEYTKPLRTVGSPVAVDGVVVLGSGDGDGSRALIAVKLDGKGDVSKTNLAWDKNNAGTPYVPSPLAHQGHVYTITDDGQAVCYEAKSGEEKWRKTRLADSFYASPVLINGNVFAISNKGDVVVFAAKPDKFELVARNKLGEQVFASPAVANGRLYVRGVKHLICVGKK